MACEILGPWLGIELVLLAVEVQTLNHLDCQASPTLRDFFFNPDFQALSTETLRPWTWVEGWETALYYAPQMILMQSQSREPMT